MRWLLPLVVAAGCSSTSSDALPFELPAGFPAPAIPDDNPLTPERAELGRYLFYETKLSGNQTQSCASCHDQALAFTDGKRVGVGSTGERHARNSPTLTNAVYNATLTWANPLLTDLEVQILLPLFGEVPVELGAGARKAEILSRLAEDPRYVELFAQAFPDLEEPINWDACVRALSAFVRTLVSGNSPFDRFVYQNDVDSLSDSARRGMELFYSERLECHHCHGGFNFTASSVHADSTFLPARFHNTGLYNIDGRGGYPANNTGLYEVTGKPGDMGKFRAPTLRNISVTAPYMHDGSMATLEEVVRFYEAGGRVVADGEYAGDGRLNPFKSGFVAGFILTDGERRDLIEFLHSLTDESFLTDPQLSSPFEEAR